jgi:hypothetical protein
MPCSCGNIGAIAVKWLSGALRWLEEDVSFGFHEIKAYIYRIFRRQKLKDGRQ